MKLLIRLIALYFAIIAIGAWLAMEGRWIEWLLLIALSIFVPLVALTFSRMSRRGRWR